MISCERAEAMSSPTTLSSPFRIYLHLLTCGDSHGFYYVIEDKGESPVPQYPRPLLEGGVEYATPVLNLHNDEEDGDGDGDEEDNDDDPEAEAESEAETDALFYGGCVPMFRSFNSEDDSEDDSYSYSDSDSDSDSDFPLKKKSKLEPVQIRIQNYSKKTKEGKIFVIYDSQTDIIRPLQFPDLPFVPAKSDLLLVGERFYLIGGYIAPITDYGFGIDFPPFTDMLCWDSDVEKVWKFLPGSNIVAPNGPMPPRKAAVWAAGTFFVMGHSFKKWRPTFRGLSSGDTEWKTLPGLPTLYMSNIDTINPLAVNGSKIFFQVGGYVVLPSDRKYRNHPVHLAAYFDVRSCQWEIVGKWFTGMWSPGVIYDGYLFSYGTTKPLWKKSHICIYSIQRQCWLRRHVRGLKRDGIVLPDDNDYDAVSTYLFQVNDNLLAFVWSGESRFRLREEKVFSDIHCTKFILHCIKDPRKKHPVFRAEVISYGTWLVEGFQLQNCFVRLNEMDMEAKVKVEHQSATT